MYPENFWRSWTELVEETLTKRRGHHEHASDFLILIKIKKSSSAIEDDLYKKFSKYKWFHASMTSPSTMLQIQRNKKINQSQTNYFIDR